MPLFSLGNAPMPSQDRISRAKRSQYGQRPDPQEGLITDTWNDFLTRLTQAVQQSPNRANNVSLNTLSASILGTDMSGGVLNAGIYTLTYRARVTTPGTVSSSLELSFAWIEGAVTQVFSTGAETGNTTDTRIQGVLPIRIDGSSPVNYAVTYASAGATAMVYDLDVILTVVLA